MLRTSVGLLIPNLSLIRSLSSVISFFKAWFSYLIYSNSFHYFSGDFIFDKQAYMSVSSYFKNFSTSFTLFSVYVCINSIYLFLLSLFLNNLNISFSLPSDSSEIFSFKLSIPSLYYPNNAKSNLLSQISSGAITTDSSDELSSTIDYSSDFSETRLARFSRFSTSSLFRISSFSACSVVTIKSTFF